MLDRIDPLELDQAGPCHAIDGLAGGVGDQVNMEAAFFLAVGVGHRCAHPVGEL